MNDQSQFNQTSVEDQIGTMAPQSQEQMPVPDQKHFINKKFIATFIALLLIGGGICAGLWWWNSKNTEPVVPTFTPRVIDETANWQTYRNEEFGFEVRYPEFFDQALLHPMIGEETVLIRYHETPDQQVPEEPNRISVSIDVVNEPLDGYEYDAIYDGAKYIYNGQDDYWEIEKLDNFPSVDLSLFNQPEFVLTGSGQKAYLFALGDGPAAQFWGVINSPDKNFYIATSLAIFKSPLCENLSCNGEEILNQILSTFKFID
ncbi:MAG: hypothetical protein COV30_01160 [Candidatus Yanofskybacteria bacterium CG10_big_fil_rev_8_21_14_0_10_37_15]|uniref:Uncharacterized protein n=1 Tax=Candidatus Yanofskybacteria bacterium CG10_big_fil_rev_8_21_14_0_10_37_15 TaxID=1975097 RepID=A0A2H0R5V8_9BACT|nr:MAG: hypothetical protein COV30_01160 [Candidatus Yanofskybacteria bacterium CG10_big_fil_rev_8_21_14_0_10_37_15]